MNSQENSVPKIAIVSIHGVGIHLPLSTLARTAAFVREAIFLKNGDRATLFASQKEFRKENCTSHSPCITLKSGNLSLDLFEGYYSPIPKGKTELKELIAFLLETGFLATGRNQVFRSINHNLTSFVVHSRTRTYLWALIATILSVMALNFLFAAQVATYVSNPTSLHSLANSSQKQLTVLLGANITYLSLVSLILFAAARFPRILLSTIADILYKFFPIVLLSTLLASGVTFFGPTPPSNLPWYGGALLAGRVVGVLVLTLIASTALEIPLTLSPKISSEATQSDVSTLNHPVRILNSRIIAFALFSILPISLYLFNSDFQYFLMNPYLRVYDFLFMGSLFLGASYFTRSLILNYVGDFASYVLGARSSKFEDVRVQIKARISGLIESVHEEYDQIVLIGHSLGSVVAYDALNIYLINHPSDSKVISLITYGSPLDKFAFLFDSESAVSDPIRHALVNSKQPMLNESIRKKITWMNIYSNLDPVAGRLDFYDIPKGDKLHDEVCTPSSGSLAKDFAYTYGLLSDEHTHVLNIHDRSNHLPIANHSNYHKHAGLLSAVAFSLREFLDVSPDLKTSMSMREAQAELPPHVDYSGSDGRFSIDEGKI